jgi:hypothetical protein
MDEHMKFISDGNKYSILQLTREHCNIVESWFDCERVHEWLDFGGGRQKLDALSLRMMSSSASHFVRIIEDGDGRPFAVFGLQQVDHPFGVAQFWGVRPMMRPPARLRPIIPMRVFFQGAIDTYGFSSIQAWAVEGNTRSMNIMKSLGFKEQGCLRRCHLINGVLRDRIMFDLLPEEFISSQEGDFSICEPIGSATHREVVSHAY